jgi:murein DD-endopeptidase MepM/ murein hydrolase activator NlpD
MGSILNFLSHALATSVLPEEGTWGEPLRNGLQDTLVIIFAIMGALSTGYAIYLGILLAKAPDPENRKKARNRIYRTVASLFIILALTTIIATDAMNFFHGTTDIVTYQLNAFSFTIDEVSGGNSRRLNLMRNGVVATNQNVTFSISSAGGTGATLDSENNLRATSTGQFRISVSYNKNVIFENETFTIRAVIPPPPQPPPGTPTIDDFIDNPFTRPPPSYLEPTDLTSAFWNPVDYSLIHSNKFFGNQFIPHITSSFGMRDLRAYGFGINLHRGIDSANNGSRLGRYNWPIYSAGIGKVTQIGWSSTGYGHWIEVRHIVNNATYYTRYAHLDERARPNIGDVVGGRAGQQFEGATTKFPYGTAIGFMGTTGMSTGIHLHFEILGSRGGQWVQFDPFNGNRAWNGRSTNNGMDVITGAGFPTFFARG